VARLRSLAFLAFALLGLSPARSAAAPTAGTTARRVEPLERYVSRVPPFFLWKPRDWKVRSENQSQLLRVTVSDPEETSRVELSYADNRQGGLDALGLLAATAQEMRRHHPDLAVARVERCRSDRSCAVGDFAFAGRGGPVQGRFFFHADAQLAVVRSYQAPAERFSARRPVLLDVLANFHLLSAEGAATPQPLVPRRAPDGSLSVSIPANWQFQGNRGTVVATEPGGASGFMFTTFQVLTRPVGVAPSPGVLVSPHHPPAEFMPVLFQKFGNRDIRILQTAADERTAADCPRYLRRACDAADVTLSWTSPKGAACTGSFKVLNATPGPSGQWFSIVAGIWGPSGSLSSMLPTLGRIAGSFTINDQYARGYIQQGVERLRAAQAKTRSAVQGLYQSIEENQADFERRSAAKAASDARGDDYRRGNSYWVSELEGGKVYATDPWGTKDLTTGDRFDGSAYGYIHFEGENPRHPSEAMRELSSDEVKQLLGR
jgi:hypothetical protein